VKAWPLLTLSATKPELSGAKSLGWAPHTVKTLHPEQELLGKGRGNDGEGGCFPDPAFLRR